MKATDKYTFTSCGLDPRSNMFPLGAGSVGAPSGDYGIVIELKTPYAQGIDERSDAFASAVTKLVDDPAAQEKAVFVCLWKDGLYTFLTHAAGNLWKLALTEKRVPDRKLPDLIELVLDGRRDVRIGFFYEDGKEEEHKKSLRIVRTTDRELTAMLAEELGIHVME